MLPERAQWGSVCGGVSADGAGQDPGGGLSRYLHLRPFCRAPHLAAPEWAGGFARGPSLGFWLTSVLRGLLPHGQAGVCVRPFARCWLTAHTPQRLGAQGLAQGCSRESTARPHRHGQCSPSLQRARVPASIPHPRLPSGASFSSRRVSQIRVAGCAGVGQGLGTEAAGPSRWGRGFRATSARPWALP